MPCTYSEKWAVTSYFHSCVRVPIITHTENKDSPAIATNPGILTNAYSCAFLLLPGYPRFFPGKVKQNSHNLTCFSLPQHPYTPNHAGMTKRLTPQQKKDRKPALRACTFCHSKHLQCSNTRPCQNCIKRNIAHECKDMMRKRAKYMAPADSDTQSETPATVDQSFFEPMLLKEDISQLIGYGVSPKMEATHSINTFHDHNDSPNSTPSTNATNFNSNFLNQEYMMLGDLISKPSSPSSFEIASAAPPLVSPNFLSEVENENKTRPFIFLGNVKDEDSRSQELNFDMSLVGKPQYVSPLISHHIYQTVQDIYSNKIINFDYPLSYHSLTHFLKSRFSFHDKDLSPEERAKKRNNLLIILRLIASYRPTFISAHKSLFQPFDFQFLEMSFQRCLLDYENLSRLNASPTIIWRRTGEIVSMSNDLVNLLGLSISDVLSKRTFIMELMYDDESIVEYFRLFKSVAVGNLHLTINTRCKLIKRSSGDTQSIANTNTLLQDFDFIEFCCVWTVKRDLFDLPMVLVGQFLPVLPTRDGLRAY